MEIEDIIYTKFCEKLKLSEIKDDINNIDPFCVLSEESKNYEAEAEGRPSLATTKCQSIKCLQCSFVTNSDKYLENHIASKHKSVKWFVCSICSFKSFYRHSVKYHIKISHKDEYVRVLTIGCVECQDNATHAACSLRSNTKKEGSKERRKSQVVAHGRKYACNLCDYKGAQKSSVRAHQKRHKEESKRIIGDSCEKCHEGILHRICKFEKVLKYPLSDKNNTVVKDAVTCVLCQEKLSSNISLKNHKEAIHLKILNYECTECPYRSYFKNCVQIHVKTIHGSSDDMIKRIDCKMCRNNEKHT